MNSRVAWEAHMSPLVAEFNKARVGNIAALGTHKERFSLISFPVKGQATRWHFSTVQEAVRTGQDMLRNNKRGQPINLHITDNGLRMTIARSTGSKDNK